MDDPNPSLDSENQTKPGSRHWKPKNHTEYYLPDDHPTFKERVKELYAISKASVKYRNKAKWAKCCKTAETHYCAGTLGHPKEECIPFKDFLQLEDLHSEENFTRFMFTMIPRNDEGLILLPQINIRHPAVKFEEGEEPVSYDRQLPVTKDEEDSRDDRLQEDLDKLRDQNESLNAQVAGLKAELEAQRVALSNLDRVRRHNQDP